MSSVTLWACPVTGVAARWNKDQQPSVFVPNRTVDGITHGVESTHVSTAAAIRAAKRKAKAYKAAGAGQIYREPGIH